MFSVFPTLLLFKSPLLDCVKVVCSIRFATTFSEHLQNSNLHFLNNRSSFTKAVNPKTSTKSGSDPDNRLYNTMDQPVGDKRFCLEDYDAIGFDLDNTLAMYNLKNLFALEYNCLRDYLVENKNYKIESFSPKFSDENFNFLQRGLIVDAKRGNLLKVDCTGRILKAAHGTKLLKRDEIITIYGDEINWEVTNEFVKDYLSTWNGPLSEQMRSFLDYFDVPGSLIFAQAIDYLDKENGCKPLESYNVYKDMQDGFIHMFTPEHFSLDKGNFFSQLKKNPEEYYEKCPPHVLSWLKELKAKNKILYLLTGSYADYAHFTASYCLGNDWKDYFNYIGFFSKKPGFFTGANRPFLSIKNLKESDEIHVSELNNSKTFSQGNWEGLMEAFKETLNKTNIKPVYMGDNFIQDIYTPSKYAKVDTVAVCLEQAADSGDSDENFLKSKAWGPYFYMLDGQMSEIPTIWGNILKHHSKICVPSVSHLATEAIDHVYCTFDKKESGLNVDGFYPTYILQRGVRGQYL